jgi:hypothetical protein
MASSRSLISLIRLIRDKHFSLVVCSVKYEEKSCDIYTCGLYYKHITMVNDESRVVYKFKTSLTDDVRVIIYDRHMFMVQATGCSQ